MRMRLKEELEVLAEFETFIVFDTRNLKRRQTTNSVNFTEQVISSVRAHYAGIQGRRQGKINGDLGGKQLKYTLNGLRKLAPSRMRAKQPIPHSDLLAYLLGDGLGE